MQVASKMHRVPSSPPRASKAPLKSTLKWVFWTQKQERGLPGRRPASLGQRRKGSPPVGASQQLFRLTFLPDQRGLLCMALISSDEHSAPCAALYFPCQADGRSAAISHWYSQRCRWLWAGRMLEDGSAVRYTFTTDESLFVRKWVNTEGEAQHASRNRSQAVEKVTPVMSVHKVSQEGAVWWVLTSQEKRF